MKNSLCKFKILSLDHEIQLLTVADGVRAHPLLDEKCKLPEEYRLHPICRLILLNARTTRYGFMCTNDCRFDFWNLGFRRNEILRYFLMLLNFEKKKIFIRQILNFFLFQKITEWTIVTHFLFIFEIY